ncbi:MAG: hypothetical protein WCO98_10805, partial [bacterium]
ELFQPVNRLRKDYGIQITHAMSADINGHNWPLGDVLLAAGIKTTSMAINCDFGGAPFTRPNLFNWQTPGGGLLPALNGWHYGTGTWVGIPDDAEQLLKNIPVIEQKLTEAGWQFPFAIMQVMAQGGDNRSADIHYSDFIRKWNEKGQRPRLRMITWREFWAQVQPHFAELPVHAGDWTDYWNFGSCSSARETAVARTSRARLRSADALHGWLEGMGVGRAGDESGADYPGRDPKIILSTAGEYHKQAWKSLETWHEHTWGWFGHVGDPEHEDAASQWNHKAHTAYQTRSLSQLLARDGAAELSIRIANGEDDAIVLFNPLPWERTVYGKVPGPIINRDTARACPDDPSSSRHTQEQNIGVPGRMEAVTVPAAGYTVVDKSKIHPIEHQESHSEGAVVEDALRRIVFDRERGGIISWFDKTLNREMVDQTSEWRFGSVVHEEVASREDYYPRVRLNGPIYWDFALHKRAWHPDWRANRGSHVKLLSHKVYHTPVAIEVVQIVEVAGLANAATLKFIMPHHTGTVELQAHWMMGHVQHPESTYIAMPFAVTDATARYDVGAQAIEIDKQQLPGSCRDYFNLQNWVDFSNDGYGVTIATPENPLAQFGDFHFAHDQRELHLERAMFLGWITNNYWGTNFRGYQPGRVTARYVVQPHADGFNETAAHRFGMETAMPCIIQTSKESKRPQTTLPPVGTLLNLPAQPVLTLHAMPSSWANPQSEDGILLRMVNASDTPQTAAIGSGLLKIESAELCDIFGNATGNLAVKDGTVNIEMLPRGIVVVRLVVSKISGK